MKKAFRIFLIAVGVLILSIIIFISITFPPVRAGMAAKTMCSCVYVTGRTPESVRQQELQVFPGLSSSEINLNNNDSTVEATIFWKTSKAIFRKGVGCTLLGERSEEEVRAQEINLAGRPNINQDSVAWPSGNLTKDTVIAGVNYEQINKAIDNAFIDKDSENPVFTHGIVVVYDGQIIGEKYAEGFDKNSRLMGWSMTKSITGTLIGLLVKDGRLKKEDPAPVKEWQNDERRNITLNNLLQASSGLQWSETYFNPWADFHNMFIRSDDKGGYAASLPLKHEAGSHFEYSSGTTNILQKIIRETVGDDEYYRFPYERLFYPIGMNSAYLEVDASGTFVGSSYCFATARDWARLGMLYQQNGIWNGEQILPEGWVSYATTPSTAAPMREYGAQIWLNQGNPNNPAETELPGLPSEAYFFRGFEKNFVAVVPSKKLVVVRLGVTHNSNFDLAALVNGVIEGLPK
jgi:CubicO group peptidase (beta-lactamase class C family)